MYSLALIIFVVSENIRDLMGNFFNNRSKFFLINCQSSYISYIDIHLEKKIVDLKTGFLRNFFYRFYRSKTDYTQ